MCGVNTMPPTQQEEKRKREGGAQPIRLRWDYEIREIIKTGLDQKGTFEYIYISPHFPYSWRATPSWSNGSLRPLISAQSSAHSDSHPLMRITVDGRNAPKNPSVLFCLFSARGKNKKTKEYITTHTHTRITQTQDNNIHLLPCVQFCGRNRVGSSFGRVSRAWETQHTGRNGHKCATTHKIENGGETVFLFFLSSFWRWMSRVSRRRQRRRQSV